MTVYTCNLLQKHHATGEHRPRLWADTADEIALALYECGASHDDQERNNPKFENYLITPDQQALAIFNGAVLTDYLEPRYQVAQREGDQAMIRSIELSRRTGLTAGTHPKAPEHPQ